MPPSEQRRPRYLIGHGEKLTSESKYPGGGSGKDEWPYSVAEAAQRLSPRMHRVITAMDALPDEACPGDESVGLLTLHPEALAKTHFPGALLAGVGLRAVGCRARTITPAKRTNPRRPAQGLSERTIELYVAGPRAHFRQFDGLLRSRIVDPVGFEQLSRVEDFRPLSDLNEEGRISKQLPRTNGVALEAALHADGTHDTPVLRGFLEFATSLGAEIVRDLIVTVPGIVFIPLRIAATSIDRLAIFSFLRTVRPPARLRTMPGQPLTRAVGSPVALPKAQPLNPAIRIAVLDGGLPPDHGLPFTQIFAAPGVGPQHGPFADHGMAVTGALLWGALNDLATPPTPVASVDHFRVLDATDAGSDDFHAYRVLRRVKDVIETGPHDIFNLSLGPEIPLDDGEVHPWTSTLDTLAADGSRLLVVAAGNNGTMPAPLNRVQVPGDGVNCLCVGAADSAFSLWSRAAFSACGPGRRPGVTKPDVLAYGGSAREPIKVVLRKGGAHVLIEQMGTSFAAPITSRSAGALRSFFSANLHPLTLKSLLIHTATADGHSKDEVGWGRIVPVTELVECPPATARVIYQGELPPKGILRVPLALPENLRGPIDITATLCYACDVRASDPLNYTNSGVEIRFRPHAERYRTDEETGEESELAATAPFFGDGGCSTEEERRVGGRKWETVMHACKRIDDANDLLKPVFDLHLVPRVGTRDDHGARVRYALIISIVAPSHSDLYELVMGAYPRLQALTPVAISATIRI